MVRSNSRLPFALFISALSLLTVTEATLGAAAPPERTYSKAPYVHRIVLLDDDGAVIRAPREGDDPAQAITKPFSMQKTCGKCHSDIDVMSHGWHFNASDPKAPHGRPGEPWILTDNQTRTQLPLSYRGWKGTFHPHDIGLNDFNFARLFSRHHTGGGALATSQDLRFKMSGALEIDCLICHTSDSRYDPVARATAITTDQNFKYAPALAAFLGKVTGSAAKLRDNYDPTGPDAKRAPKVNYDWSRFDELSQVHFDLTRKVPNERCYFCHTALDAGSKSGEGNAALESRWQHDQDIHLAKGMQCVDCHRHGADHMVARGYEGEYEDRLAAQGDKSDKSITTLSCQGCHYGTDAMAGGRNAAPRPVHKGLPTLHFDKLTCTACHSGPAPRDATTLVQTSMAHKLGLPRHHTADTAAPTIQQPVFLRVDKWGQVVLEGTEGAKIAPHRMIVPSFWGRMNNGKITPIAPQYVLAAGAGDVLGAKPGEKDFEPMPPLTEEQIAKVLEKLAAAPPPTIKPADVVTARSPPAPTTAPATTAATTAATAAATAAATTAATATAPAPAAWAEGEVVFVTGQKAYKRGSDGKLESSIAVEGAAYFWPLAHDVRPAQQSLGARGCVECHALGAPIFDGSGEVTTVTSAAPEKWTMRQARMESTGALNVFAATYPLRPVLIIIGYLSAGVLLLVLLSYGTRGVAAIAQRRTR